MRVFNALVAIYDACLENATDLLAEAQLLASHHHTARAFALALTGWEEVGKAQLVADFAYDMVAEEEFESAFRDHYLKSSYNSRQFVLNPADMSDSTIEYDRSRAVSAFRKRQEALYVEKTADLRPLTPKEAVAEEDVHAMISALESELKNIRRMDAVTERIGSRSFLK